jgi:predicted transcriptional regulator
MKALIIDGIVFAQKMTEAGMEERQARALAAELSALLRENVVSDLVTKEFLKSEMARLKAELVLLFFGANAVMGAAIMLANKFL